MERSCWIKGVYRTEYHIRIVTVFRIFTKKWILNHYWIVSVFEHGSNYPIIIWETMYFSFLNIELFPPT